MIAILDYGAGNLTSVKLAFQRLGAPAIIASEAGTAATCERIVFPGVGSAASGMAGIRQRGFDRLLRQVWAEKRPLLGICLGMQLLFEHSAEDGGQPGVGLLPGQVLPFSFPGQPRIKIPQMGWNSVSYASAHPLLAGLPPDEAFYFVHSYYAAPARVEDICGRTEYGGLTFTSIAARGSLFATQFHPERSGEAGLVLLRNFLSWDGRSLC